MNNYLSIIYIIIIMEDFEYLFNDEMHMIQLEQENLKLKLQIIDLKKSMDNNIENKVKNFINSDEYDVLMSEKNENYNKKYNQLRKDHELLKLENNKIKLQLSKHEKLDAVLINEKNKQLIKTNNELLIANSNLKDCNKYLRQEINELKQIKPIEIIKPQFIEEYKQNDNDNDNKNNNRELIELTNKNIQLATKNFNNEQLINDLRYKISQLRKKNYKSSNDDNDNETNSNSSNDNNDKIKLSYHEIPELSIKKMYDILISSGFKYNDIKNEHTHVLKTMINKVRSNKLERKLEKK